MFFSCASTKSNSLMTPVMGETDTILMSDMMPVALKAIEVLHHAVPKNDAIHELTASLYVMYANAFVQHKADMMDAADFELQYSEKMRAKMHYLRGRDYSLSYFDSKYKNFSKNLFSKDPELEQLALKKLKVKDVPAAYWLGAACLGAFSLDPLDVEMLSSVNSALAILERAAELDPTYNKGAIWDVLVAFYAGAPAEFGGNIDKAVAAFLKEVECSKGETTSLYMTYAQVFCKNNIDLSSYAWDCSVSIEELGWKFPEIPRDVMKKRSKFLSEIKSEITVEENEHLVGTTQNVLVVEKGSKGGFIAKTDSYIPVIVDDVELGSFVDVKITDATATYLLSELLKD